VCGVSEAAWCRRCYVHWNGQDAALAVGLHQTFQRVRYFYLLILGVDSKLGLTIGYLKQHGVDVATMASVCAKTFNVYVIAVY